MARINAIELGEVGEDQGAKTIVTANGQNILLNSARLASAQRQGRII
jgi:hypothetical protein